jgi:hypothetical protein
MIYESPFIFLKSGVYSTGVRVPPPWRTVPLGCIRVQVLPVVSRSGTYLLWYLRTASPVWCMALAGISWTQYWERSTCCAFRISRREKTKDAGQTTKLYRLSYTFCRGSYGVWPLWSTGSNEYCLNFFIVRNTQYSGLILGVYGTMVLHTVVEKSSCMLRGTELCYVCVCACVCYGVWPLWGTGSNEYCLNSVQWSHTRSIRLYVIHAYWSTL